jgi:hypothetical protein
MTVSPFLSLVLSSVFENQAHYTAEKSACQALFWFFITKNQKYSTI